MTRQSRTPPPEEPAPAKEPDRPDFETLYREQNRFVWSVLKHMGVADRHLEDALQDVFVVVHRRLPQYQPRGLLLGWLATIAAKVANHYRRREFREPLAGSLQAELSDRSPDAQGAVEARDLLLVVLAAIEDPGRQQVFVLRYFDDLTIKQIAIELGIPKGTVVTRLRLARADLTAALTRLRARERRHVGAPMIPLLGALLEIEGTVPPLPEGVANRVWGKLQRSPEIGAGHVPEDRGRTDRKDLGPARPARVAAALLGGVAVGLALGVLWSPLHRARPTIGEARADALVMTAPASPLPAPSSEPAPGKDPPPASTERAKAAPDVAVERALVDRASGALTSGDTAAALAAVQEHARIFRGGGQLAEERDAIWIAALIRAGRQGEARERLDRFARRYPGSGRLAAFHQALPSRADP